VPRDGTAALSPPPAGAGERFRRLGRLLEGLGGEVDRLDPGCCGLARNFGLSAGTSTSVGAGSLHRALPLDQEERNAREVGPWGRERTINGLKDHRCPPSSGRSRHAPGPESHVGSAARNSRCRGSRWVGAAVRDGVQRVASALAPASPVCRVRRKRTGKSTALVTGGARGEEVGGRAEPHDMRVAGEAVGEGRAVEDDVAGRGRDGAGAPVGAGEQAAVLEQVEPVDRRQADAGRDVSDDLE
jgi:hypothetical protein